MTSLENLEKRVRVLEKTVNLLVTRHSYGLGGGYLEQQIEEIKKEILGLKEQPTK
jgi:hypothetical protein